MQRICGVAMGLVDGVAYRCLADPSFAANPYDSDTPGHYVWHFEGYGAHSCPDNGGDPVVVNGELFVSFNGYPLGPFSCEDMGSCNTRTGVTVSWKTATVMALIKSLTVTYERPEGLNEYNIVFVYP